MLLALNLHHFGMAQYVQDAHLKLQSGMENIVIIVLQELIGINNHQNVLHVQMDKYSIQLKICVYVLLKHLSWQPMELASYVIGLDSGMKGIDNV